ncbi:MAG: hypothetical protein JWQ09_2856 [Segetibacter sp.]|nr:hypothetical protein [Segetibacter sp.]
MTKALPLILASFLYTVYTTAQTKIPIDEAGKHIGEIVTVCDKVYGGRFVEKSKTQPTFLNLGAAFPKQKLTILINFGNRKYFPEKPEEYYPLKNVCVTGKLIDYEGLPEIIVNKPEEIKIDETHQGIEKVEPHK